MRSKIGSLRSSAAGVYGIRFNAMASDCEVQLLAPSPKVAGRVTQVAIDVVRRIEHKFSRYRPDSIVSQINAAAGQYAIACDAETAGLLDYADTLHKASNGLFDITSGVLRRAWDFRSRRLPEPRLVEACLNLVGWEYVHREPSQAIEPGGQLVQLAQQGMEIDFGGLGKEYAVDRAATVLQEAGVSSGFVRLGTDLRVLGPRPDGSPWSFEIPGSTRPGGQPRPVALSSGALATSSIGTQGFELDGRHYGHLLNPRNGQPVQGLRSVSVLAPLAAAAGSCATIAMLKEKGAREFLMASGFEFIAYDDAGVSFERAALVPQRRDGSARSRPAGAATRPEPVPSIDISRLPEADRGLLLDIAIV